MKKVFHFLVSSLGFIFFVAALVVLYRELRLHPVADLLREFQSIPSRRLSLAFLFTVLNYIVLTGYEAAGLHYAGQKVEYGKIAEISFIANALSNNLGAALFSGSAVRLRLYSAWGLSGVETTAVLLFYGLTFILGFFALAGFSFAFDTVHLSVHLPVPLPLRALGILFLCLTALYLLLSLTFKKNFSIRGTEFRFPSFPLALTQILFSLLDWLLLAAILYVLILQPGAPSFFRFLTLFMLGQLAGLVSQVPAGLGVFEAVMLTSLTPALPADRIFTALLIFRFFYYILPLAAATILLAIHEIRMRKNFSGALSRLGEWIVHFAPNLLSFSTFVAGVVLLFSGATPGVERRMLWLQDFLPLPVLEVSHFLGSLAGAGLLFLANGLQRRLDAAYVFTLGLLGSGIVFSLLKGADYEEALILVLMFAALFPAHSLFYRKASLLAEPFTPGWILSILSIFAASVWLGLFVYKHVEYSKELWWHFGLLSDAPRFMRGMVGAAMLTIALSLLHLMRSVPAKTTTPDFVSMNKVHEMVLHSKSSESNLALLGDKEFLFSPSGKSFLMYCVQGKSCIAAGDPVGKEEEWADLVWEFHDFADAQERSAVFWEVGPAHLSLYLEAGLTALKIGEEAHIPLPGFSLEGGSRKEFRHTMNQLEKQGCCFEILPPGKASAYFKELRAISDAWLEKKNTREKGFSLGFYDETYLSFFPTGIIRWNGKIIAFTNIWANLELEEVSVDLMRYDPQEAPAGLMDYLFIHLFLWGKKQGYQTFNMGMAPLAGLENRPYGSLWNKAGSLIYKYGEHFYNFQGLRQYKDKFHPTWRPKYLAYPGGFVLPRVLTDIAALGSGGMKGLLGK